MFPCILEHESGRMIAAQTSQASNVSSTRLRVQGLGLGIESSMQVPHEVTDVGVLALCAVLERGQAALGYLNLTSRRPAYKKGAQAPIGGILRRVT